MTHPYRNRPATSFWRRSVADRPWSDVTFVEGGRLTLDGNTRIATAGSCFASNVLRWLPRLGLRPFFTEVAPSWFTADEARAHGYGEFAARYGNIYTVRQLRQLVEEALGHRPPIEAFDDHAGAVWDLLRPHVRPGGFASVEEARHDRAYHLRCVERLLRESDVFVFTLGLTEAWVDDRSGVVFPVCPGTVAGRYDPAHHRPVNFDHPAVVDDLCWVIDAVAAVNPGLRWIVTVSPVPLVATHGDDHVVVASTYSKSVLRAACGAVEAGHPSVTYFPSYEIIASPQSFGQYLASDLREVTDRGIQHVMRVFERTFVAASSNPDVAPEPAASPAHDGPTAAPGLGREAAVAAALAGECDELMNDR
ncbi:MAG: GSCFA domain-containing protein [Acidimicrobiia bacterium]